MGCSSRGKWTRQVVAAALFAHALGCGARATVDGAGQAEEDEERPGLAGAGAAGGRGGGSAGNATPRLDPVSPVMIDLGSTPLPECEPGFLPFLATTRECTYMYEELCYEGSLQACACACTGPRQNRCIIGGFLNPDEPQTVSCIAQ